MFFCLKDPTSALIQLAEKCGMGERFHALSLGQGQAPIATRMIKEGVKEVGWSAVSHCYDPQEIQYGNAVLSCC